MHYDGCVPFGFCAATDGAGTPGWSRGVVTSLAIITFFFPGYGVRNVNAEKCLWNFPNVVISQVYETETIREVT